MPLDGGDFGDEELYWTRYTIVGLVVLAVESLGALAYFLLSPSGLHRALLDALAATVAAAALVALPFVRHVARRPWRSTFSLSLALGTGAFLTLCCYLDGGLDSPMLFLLALPVAHLAITFPPRTVALSAWAAVTEFALVARFDPDIASSLAVLALLIAFLGGMITLALGWSFARSNLDEQRRAQFAESVRQAKTDVLTGCLNHRAFFERLQTEIERALRHGEELSLLMADVDMFKSFNDRYGHPAGDDALTTIGSAMMRSARSIDIVGRIGGDELAVILPATGLPGAHDAAERMAGDLRNPRGVDVTVSVGYASLDRSEPTSKRLFRDADAGLYLAKVNGRARTSGSDADQYGSVDGSLSKPRSLRIWREADAKRFEGAVRQARTQTSETLAILDTLETSNSIGIAFIDSEFRVLRINPVLAAVNGGTVEEQVGKTVAEAVPDLWPVVEPAYRTVLETGVPLLDQEVSGELATEPGISHTWLTNLYPVTAKGVRTGLCVIAVDITARKQLESSQASLTSSVVGALAAAVEMRDPYTGGHQDRVAEIAVAIASELGVDPDEAKAIELAAKIHDLGKLAVPAEVLGRPGRLSSGEMALVREHARAGSDMLEHVGFPDHVRLMVLQHHERLDGSGYPDALSGDEVLLGSRIIAVADVMEAISAHRPYRAAHGIAVALKEIQEGSGTRYDPAVVRACVRLVSEGRFRHFNSG
jgi:diguanylate cyclase (GGDEF)-like protein/PAS domain S-box-containing protein